MYLPHVRGVVEYLAAVRTAPLIVCLPRLRLLLGSLIRARTLTGVLGSIDYIHISHEPQAIRSIRLFAPPLRSLTSRILDLLADMNKSRLPIEICEHIIDSCPEPDKNWYGRPWYHTLRQTALVCSAWLPRSRINLFYEVDLSDAYNVDLFLRTLQEAPHFADMVLRLTVDTYSNSYQPLAQMQLVLLLKNCVALRLFGSDWAVMYPSRHADRFLHPWSGRIVELRLQICIGALRTIIRFIWSLHHLQNLWLSWESSRFITRWRPDLQAGKCHSLGSLKFGVRNIVFYASVARIY